MLRQRKIQPNISIKSKHEKKQTYKHTYTYKSRNKCINAKQHMDTEIQTDTYRISI